MKSVYISELCRNIGAAGERNVRLLSDAFMGALAEGTICTEVDVSDVQRRSEILIQFSGVS